MSKIDPLVLAGRQGASIAAKLLAMNTGLARPTRTYQIIIAPAGKGQFSAHLGDQPLGTFRCPLLDSARILSARGVPDDDEITMVHAGATTITMRTKIGDASRLTVEESGHGPIFRPERQGPGAPVDGSPVAETDPAATRGPETEIARPSDPYQTFMEAAE